MNFSNPPSKEKIVDQGGMGTWQWLKWFETIRKTLNFFVEENNVSTVTINTTLTEQHGTVVVEVSGLTITLPAASAARYGREWTVILGVVGWVDITTSNGDTIVIPVDDDTIRLTIKGASLTLRCVSANSWGIA